MDKPVSTAVRAALNDYLLIANVDSSLNNTSVNPVQNKVLYDPVTFAESERQKSKNLFDINNCLYHKFSNLGETGTNITTEDSNIRITLNPNNLIKVNPNTQYTLSTNNSNFKYAIGQLTSNKTTLGDSGWQTNSSFTITTSSTTEYLGINFGKTDDSEISETDYINFVSSLIMLEKGSVATAYQSYNGAIVHREELNTRIKETENKIPTVNDATLTMQLNGSNVATFTSNANSDVTANIQALPNFSLNINHQTAGNPRQVKFLTVNYGTRATYFKMSATSCHDNGSSYQFLEDIIIGCTTSGKIICNVYKYCQAEVTLDNVTRNYGDIFYVHDSTNKTVDFYILCGQYSNSQFTPATKIGNTTIAYVTQYTGTATYYSSGDKVWANGNSTTYSTKADLGNYLPLTGGTLTGKTTFTNGADETVRINSTDAGMGIGLGVTGFDTTQNKAVPAINIYKDAEIHTTIKFPTDKGGTFALKEDIPSSQEVAWGKITGTLSNQKDLKNQLDNKLSIDGGTLTKSTEACLKFADSSDVVAYQPYVQFPVPSDTLLSVYLGRLNSTNNIRSLICSMPMNSVRTTFFGDFETPMVLVGGNDHPQYSKGEMTNGQDIALLSDIPKVWNGTQSEYDAITTKDPNTYYFIKES